MKLIKYIFIFLLCGCSSTKVVYDYNPDTDFSVYKTYDFFEDAGEGMNELEAKRYINAIDVMLDSLGFRRVDQPDFYIHIISQKNELPKDKTVGVGVGGGRNVGFSLMTGISFGAEKLEENIIVDFVDAKSNKLFWQGDLKTKVRKKTTPQQKDKLVREIIKKIVEKYPPN